MLPQGGTRLAGALLHEQNDAWTVHRAGTMSRATTAQSGDDPTDGLIDMASCPENRPKPANTLAKAPLHHAVGHDRRPSDGALVRAAAAVAQFTRRAFFFSLNSPGTGTSLSSNRLSMCSWPVPRIQILRATSRVHGGRVVVGVPAHHKS